MVEGCKFSFWRKLSEREGGRGRGLWCGLIAAIKLDMALWGLALCAVCIVQSAMCNLLCDMWYGFTMPWTPSISTLCTSHEIWQRLYEPLQLQFARTPMIPGLDFLTHTTHWTHRGLDLQCPRRENICDGHPSCWHWKFTQFPARVGSKPYPDRSVAANEPGADSKDTKAALSRPPSHALSSVSKYLILNTMAANVQM